MQTAPSPRSSSLSSKVATAVFSLVNNATIVPLSTDIHLHYFSLCLQENRHDQFFIHADKVVRVVKGNPFEKIIHSKGWCLFAILRYIVLFTVLLLIFMLMYFVLVAHLRSTLVSTAFKSLQEFLKLPSTPPDAPPWSLERIRQRVLSLFSILLHCQRLLPKDLYSLLHFFLEQSSVDLMAAMKRLLDRQRNHPHEKHDAKVPLIGITVLDLPLSLSCHP